MLRVYFLHSAVSMNTLHHKCVIPAKAGIQSIFNGKIYMKRFNHPGPPAKWIPAFAGMTSFMFVQVFHLGFGFLWIPAFAGMTTRLDA